MRWRHEKQPVLSDDEQIGRYAYVLGNVPASVADKAYAAAFAGFPAAQREDILGQLLSQLPPGAETPPSDDPLAFASFMRDLMSRDALVRIPSAAVFAAAFVASPPVAAYFTTGAVSVNMDHQPPWVHALGGHETAPVDAGRVHHRPRLDMGDWRGAG